jgi:hypothetical protein
MQFNVEKKISNFVESQFPQFYLEDGPTFVLFVKAYYEWLESEGQAINQARSLFDLRDIDNTLNSFLEHFQKKYLYGVPFNVIINKRFLLKHILDVYRSKGSIQCYKLLFKLIYNQDVEVYLPGVDLLKPSDGTWILPQYLEVTNSPNLKNYVGKEIVGLSSNTSAVVESYVQEPINQNIIGSLTISNIFPRGGTFVAGEEVIMRSDVGNTAVIFSAPIVIGSLDSLKIINGGQGFAVGDIIKIVHRSLSNNDVISYGVDGLVRVTGLQRQLGAINFDIINGGFGYDSNLKIFIYRGDGDTTGTGASFEIGSLSYNQSIQHNTDLIVDYANLAINTTSFGFPANTGANNTSTLQNTLAFTNTVYGTLATLNNVFTGNNYTQTPYVFVRSVQDSTTKLVGSISYSTSSNTITGTSTAFTSYFSNGDVICLQANTLNNLTREYQVIRGVNSDTDITLYGPPKFSSTASAFHRTAPVTLPSNFALYDPPMVRPDQTINGQNEVIYSNPSSGNSIIATTTVYNSGKGYVQDEVVEAYLYSGIAPITIVASGTGYINNDPLVVSGGNYSTRASGYVTTNGTGAINSAILDYNGSGYEFAPTIGVKSRTGNGAVLTTKILEYNTQSKVVGKVNKRGVGRGKGYWSTTRGFLNSDKYIQDSYFYQDFSYQIKAASTLDKYKDILYTTFHTSGTELFGQYYSVVIDSSLGGILHETTIPVIDPKVYITGDVIYITADDYHNTVDEAFINSYTADTMVFETDSTIQKADQTAL